MLEPEHLAELRFLDLEKGLRSTCWLSFQAKAMVQGRDRRVELGFQLALECRKQVSPEVLLASLRFQG